MSDSNFFQELKRRNVYKVGIAYLGISWLVSQVASLGLESFEAPGWIIKALLILLLIGFPIALVIAWVFEMTSEGLKRTDSIDRAASITKKTGKKLNLIILGALVIIILSLVIDRFRLESKLANPVAILMEPSMTPLQRKLKDKKVAILPFQNNTNTSELDAFGLLASDLITQGLMTIAQNQIINVSNSPEILLASINEPAENDYLSSMKPEIIIQGRYYLQETNIILHSNIVEVSTGNIIYALKPITGPREDMMKLMEDLRDQILGFWTYGDVKKYEGKLPKYAAYQKYVEGISATRTSPQRSIELFREAYELDTTFYEPLAKAAASYSNIGRMNAIDSLVSFVRTRNPRLSRYEELRFQAFEAMVRENLEEQVRLYETLRSEFPNEDIAHYQAALYNIFSNNFTQAIEIIENDYPRDVSGCATCWVHNLLVTAKHFLGKYDEVIAYHDSLRITIEYGPFYMTVLRSSIRLGLDSLVNALVDRLLDTRMHGPGGEMNPVVFLRNVTSEYHTVGNHSMTEKYGRQLLRHIDPENANQVFYANLYLKEYQQGLEAALAFRDKDPTNISRNTEVATFYALMGNGNQAISWTDSIRSSLVPSYDDELIPYNVAKIEALLGDRDAAVQSLAEAIDKGLSPFRCFTNREFFYSLKDHQGFVELVNVR